MELLLPLLAALLVGTGVFLVLSRAMIRLIIGLSMIAYGANLSILLVAGARLSDPPLTDLKGPFVDPVAASLDLNGDCHRFWDQPRCCLSLLCARFRRPAPTTSKSC